MEFRLVYDGRLPAASRSETRNVDKDRIRLVFHRQIEELFRTHPSLTSWLVKDQSLEDMEQRVEWDYRDEEEAKQERLEFWRSRIKPSGKVSTVDVLAYNHERCGKRYVPLITSKRGIACSLDILFLRRDQPGNLIVSGGDLDNRIKVLFDALRMPQNNDEVFDLPEGEDKSHPTYVLLEDDRLIVDVKVTSDRLLTPRQDGEHINDVRLILHVKTVVLDATKMSAFVF